MTAWPWSLRKALIWVVALCLGMQLRGTAAFFEETAPFERLVQECLDKDLTCDPFIGF